MQQDGIFDQVTGKIIQSLENGVVPWRKPWVSLAPQNINGREYTGINRLLLSLSAYDYPIFLTMKQTNDLGGYIKRGEKSHLAVFWKVVTYKDRNSSGEETVNHVPYLRYYNVFNIDQTTVPISAVKHVQIRSVEETEYTDPVTKAQELIASMTDIPAIQFNADRAAYSPGFDRIMLPHRNLFQSDEEFFATEFHEIVHSTGHPRRLNRKGLQEVRFGSEEYSKEELVAEIGSCFLSNLCGMISCFENAVSYVQGWIKALRDDPRMVVHAAGQAEKAVEFLTGHSKIQ